MHESDELTYTLYLMRSVLRDCIDKLDFPPNREAFLLYYGISSKQSDEIDKLFLDILRQKDKISFTDFKQILNEKLDTDFDSQIVKAMLQPYKDYQPLAISKIIE